MTLLVDVTTRRLLAAAVMMPRGAIYSPARDLADINWPVRR